MVYSKINIAIIGLGYVGLPLAVLFSKSFNVVGYDISERRINKLKLGIDEKKEYTKEELIGKNIHYTTNIDDISEANLFIITVPTPIDKFNKPDITMLIESSKTIATVLKKGDIVVYESTVYPGATEEDCIPILEKYSNLYYNKDFFVGYSPERINIGDKKHSIEKIQKVISGSLPWVAEKLNKIYSTVLDNGTYIVPSIKIAEATKVIENCQRDVNIAFVNEMKMLLDTLNISSKEVFAAAKTRWNWANFVPGLVGGHCISVDPYYLISKSIQNNFSTNLLSVSREINNGMAQYIVEFVIKEIIKHKLDISELSILILGITFKENCNDIRNSKVIDVYNLLISYNIKDINIYDSEADAEEVKNMYSIDLLTELNNKKYSVILKLVNHSKFKSIDLNSLIYKNGFIYEL